MEQTSGQARSVCDRILDADIMAETDRLAGAVPGWNASPVRHPHHGGHIIDGPETARRRHLLRRRQPRILTPLDFDRPAGWLDGLVSAAFLAMDPWSGSVADRLARSSPTRHAATPATRPHIAAFITTSPTGIRASQESPASGRPARIRSRRGGTCGCHTSPAGTSAGAVTLVPESEGSPAPGVSSRRGGRRPARLKRPQRDRIRKDSRAYPGARPTVPEARDPHLGVDTCSHRAPGPDASSPRVGHS